MDCQTPRDDNFMGSAAVVQAFEDINAALAVLAVEVAGSGSGPFSDVKSVASAILRNRLAP
jgi:hypothetical protein